MTKPLLPIGLREDSCTGGHTQVSVFIGRNEGARGRSGVITVRNDEWVALQAAIEDTAKDLIEVMDPLHTRTHGVGVLE